MYLAPSRSSRRRRLLAAPAVALACLLAASFVLPASVGSAAVQPVATGVIVRLAPGATIAGVNSIHKTVTRRALTAMNAYLVTGAGRTAEALQIELAADPFVAVAELNKTTRSPEVAFSGRLYRWSAATSSAAGTQWAASTLNLAGAHKLATGSGTVVAVIDTGVAADHPALAGAVTAGYDYVDRDTTPTDVGNGVDENANGQIDEAVGHGTHVASIIRRTAPGARIMPMRVLDSDGNSDSFTLAEAMIGALNRGADVVNLSLGQLGSSALLKDTAERLWTGGVVVIGAVGNEGSTKQSYPAASKCALAVASVGSTNNLSTFSSYGSKTDVAAPGEGIVGALPGTSSGYASWSGTSMAAPFVAGEAALLISQRPSLLPGAVAQLIVSNTVPIGAGADKVNSGRINPVAALQAASTIANSGACPK